MTRPRMLFVAHDVRIHQNKAEALFHSVYQEEEPLLSSGQQQIRTNEAEAPLDEVSQPIRGLICLRGDTNVVICNPGAKTFRHLPEIQRPNGEASIRCFFEYDESTDVFKVLCIIQFGDGKRTKEFHVYTVTGGSVEDSSWRRITCNHDHSPVTQGLFKGGSLYYGAQSNISDKSLVMSFNVTSEDFTVIELPEDIVQLDHRWKLVNYNGDIALVNDSEFKTGTVDIWDEYDDGIERFVLWVRKEISGKWEKTIVKIPQWLETVEHHMFVFNGTIGETELVFAPYCWLEGQIFVVYYDTDTENLRRFEIEGMVDGYYNVRTFLDHVDSTWLI